MTVDASQVEGGEIGSRVDYEIPEAECDGAEVRCEPESGSLFAVGTTEVRCTAENTDGVTDDRFLQVIDPESPLYGVWRYEVAATGDRIMGRATSVKLSPGRKYASSVKVEGTSMKVKGSFRTRKLTVRVKVPGGIKDTLRATEWDGTCGG